nr:hypothetical protein [Bradyrhizobium sp. WSM2793]
MKQVRRWNAFEDLYGMNSAVLLISDRDRDFPIHSIDAEKDGSTANSDHGSRRRDLHVAGFRDLASDETGGTLDESEHRMVRATRQAD